MPKYVALITGDGFGCDYSIDCNKTWKFFKAKNMKEALEIASYEIFWGDPPEVEGLIKEGNFSLKVDPEICSIQVIEIKKEQNVDVEKTYEYYQNLINEADSINAAKYQKELEIREKKLLTDLIKKYPNFVKSKKEKK